MYFCPDEFKMFLQLPRKMKNSVSSIISYSINTSRGRLEHLRSTNKANAYHFLGKFLITPSFWNLLHTCISKVNRNCRDSMLLITKHPKMESWITHSEMQYYLWCYLSHSDPSSSNCSCCNALKQRGTVTLAKKDLPVMNESSEFHNF